MPSLSRRVARLSRSNRRKNSTAFLQYVNAIDFLEAFDIANIEQASADELRFSCPFPGHSHGDEKPSAYMNDGSKDSRSCSAWKCHGCGRGGNAITFYAEYEQVSRTQAMKFIREHYAPGYTKPRDGIGAEFLKRRKRLKEDRELAGNLIEPLNWSQYEPFEVDWPSFESGYEDQPDVMYMYNRGFSTADLVEWKIGYDSDSRRLTIPIVGPDGNLIGIKGRAWEPDAKPKYLILGDTPRRKDAGRPDYGFKPYEKSLVVFGLNVWGEQDSYVFCEGEIDVMSFWKMGIPAICTGGTHLSDYQTKLVRQYANQVVLFLDDDKAGDHGINGFDDADGQHHPGAIEKLEPFLRVRLVGPHKHDANDYLCKGKQRRVEKLVSEARSAFVR